MVKRITVLFLAAVVLAAGSSPLFSCRLKRSSPENDRLQEAPIYVKAVFPDSRLMEEVIEAHGNLEPIEQVEVVARASGRITRVHVMEGDTVEKGRLLAEIDDQELRLSLSQARNAHRVARSDYLSSKELFDQGMKSRSELEKMKRAYDDAQANLRMSELRLADSLVRTPMAGTVLKRNVELYQQVSTMESAFTVGDLSRFKVRLTVTESEVAKLQVGQPVRIRVDAVATDPDSYPFLGRVGKIHPRVDPQTGTVEIEILLPEMEPRVRPGMFARLKIVTAARPRALTIPRRALISERGSQVWVAEGDRARLVSVELGLSDRDGLEVVAGLGPDDLVIVEGQGALTSQSRIEVVEGEARRSAGVGLEDALP